MSWSWDPITGFFMEGLHPLLQRIRIGHPVKPNMSIAAANAYENACFRICFIQKGFFVLCQALCNRKICYFCNWK